MLRLVLPKMHASQSLLQDRVRPRSRCLRSQSSERCRSGCRDHPNHLRDRSAQPRRPLQCRFRALRRRPPLDVNLMSTVTSKRRPQRVRRGFLQVRKFPLLDLFPKHLCWGVKRTSRCHPLPSQSPSSVQRAAPSYSAKANRSGRPIWMSEDASATPFGSIPRRSGSCKRWPKSWAST